MQRKKFESKKQQQKIKKKGLSLTDAILGVIIVIGIVKLYPYVLEYGNKAKDELQGMQAVSEMRVQFRNAMQHHFRTNTGAGSEEGFWNATGAGVRPWWAKCFKIQIVDETEAYIKLQKSGIDTTIEDNKICEELYVESQIALWLRGSGGVAGKVSVAAGADF